MPKFAARVDSNQGVLVRALKQLGFSVCHLHTVGRGVPDILVGRNGVNTLIEIKDSRGILTPDEKVWHDEWRGQVDIARTIEEAIEIHERQCRLLGAY